MHLQLFELLQNSTFVKKVTKRGQKSFFDLIFIEHQRNIIVVAIP